jgi:hydrogenase nickel incorporation protein HypA/HybF
MHELSIAQSLVELAEEAAAREGARAVTAVRLRLGAMAGVVEDSLRFCYGMVTEGTLLAGSRLEISVLPVIIHCAQCEQDATLSGIQAFSCPNCGTATADLRQGRELEIESLEIEV